MFAARSVLENLVEFQGAYDALGILVVPWASDKLIFGATYITCSFQKEQESLALVIAEEHEKEAQRRVFLTTYERKQFISSLSQSKGLWFCCIVNYYLMSSVPRRDWHKTSFLPLSKFILSSFVCCSIWKAKNVKIVCGFFRKSQPALVCLERKPGLQYLEDCVRIGPLQKENLILW